MATHKYRIYDAENGQYLTPEFDGVLDTKALSGVEVTSGSNEITVASTTDVFPFMALSIRGLPPGSFVGVVKSSTVLVAMRVLDRPDAWVTGTAYTLGECVWFPELQQIYRCTVAHTAASTFVADFTAGKWTLVSDPLIVPALAESSASGMTGHAHAVSPAIPELLYDGSTYRNEWTRPTGAVSLKWNSGSAGGTTNQTVSPSFGNLIVHPDAVPKTSGSPEEIAWTHLRIATPDTEAGIPPRPEPKWQSFWYFIHSAGAFTKFPARPGTAPVRTGAGT